MKIPIEWEYMLIMLVVTVLSVVGWQEGLIDDIHTMFAIGGTILTLMVIIAFPVDVVKMNVGNFLLQTGILSLGLGIPALAHPGETFLGAPPPYVLFVGIATEEIIRIAAYFLVVAAFDMPKFAVGVSGIVFAALHLYWYPTDWVSAIVAGILFSMMLLYFGSQTACVASHFSYDLLAFGYLSIWVFIIISLISLILGYALQKKKVEI